MKVKITALPSRVDEITAWKKRGLAGPYRLKSGEMGGALDILKQYVTPDGQKPTHFIHFGKVEEGELEPAQPRRALTLADLEKDREREKPIYIGRQIGELVPDPTLGPVQWLSLIHI